MVAATTFLTSLRILLSDLDPSHLQRNSPSSWTPFRFRSADGVSIESREISVMFKDLVPPAGRDDSATTSAFSLGLSRHCRFSSRGGSDRHLSSAPAAVSMGSTASSVAAKCTPKSAHSLQRDSRAWPVRGYERLAARQLAPASVSLSLEGVVPRSRTRVARLVATTTARLAAPSAISLGLPHLPPPPPTKPHPAFVHCL